MKILSSSPTPVSYPKKGSPFVSSDDRFAATPSDIFLSSVPSTCCVSSSVSPAFLLMADLTLVTWHSACSGAWVCLCVISKNLSNDESLTCVTLIPFWQLKALPYTKSF